MTRDRMLTLLKELDPDLKEMLANVLHFEQEYISYDRIPQRGEKIDDIVAAAAQAKLGTTKLRTPKRKK